MLLAVNSQKNDYAVWYATRHVCQTFFLSTVERPDLVLLAVFMVIAASRLTLDIRAWEAKSW